MNLALILLCAGYLITGQEVCAQEKMGTLKGRIETPKGKPIAGAEIRVMSPRTRVTKETSTDEAGNFSFELAADQYVVSFDAEGFQGGTLREMQQVEEGKETQVKTVQLSQAKKSSLVRGAVFDADGRSLAGAHVKLARVPTDEQAKSGKKIESLNRSYVTNSRGEFAFRLPPQRARYKVTASLNGYKGETKTVEVNEDESVPLAFSLEPIVKK
jgi:hypothetical protein